MGAVQTRVEHPTFETVWAALQEVAASQKETDRLFKESAERHEREMKEFDLRQKESAERHEREMKEFDLRQKERTERHEREMKESAERFNREMKERAERFDKQLGKLGNRFGEMVEYMVVPNLIAKFHELGFVFEKAYMDAEIKDKKNNIFTEVDITLENGDKVMIVEVKSKPTTENVTEHIERMEKVRRHGSLHGDRRIFLGAIAGMIIQDNVKQFILKNGFYVIEPARGELRRFAARWRKPGKHSSLPRLKANIPRGNG
jgi:hypothetical protein